MIPSLPPHLRELESEGLTAANLRFLEALARQQHRKPQMSATWTGHWLQLRLALDSCAMMMQAIEDANAADEQAAPPPNTSSLPAEGRLPLAEESQ